MRTLMYILQKEFRQIFRNKAILAIILAMPVIQLLIIPLAADYEIRNINLAVVDHDQSDLTHELVTKIVSSGYFRLRSFTNDYSEAMSLIENDDADLILEIPAGFERNLVRENEQKVLIAVNAINGTKGGLGGAYLSGIIRQFNQQIRLEQIEAIGATSTANEVEIRSSNWFNPSLNYNAFIVPGILAILVTMVGGFLTSLNIVKEKEVGTIEQINVTPIKKHIFIIGKLLPFWMLSNVGFSIGLLVTWGIYGIMPQGSLLVLYSFIWLYLLAVLGFGLLISTFCENQQQAMFIMFFFMMIFILMGGLFTPIESMPDWAQTITRFNPLAYLIAVMRMIVLKGSGWTDILPHAGRVALFALVLNVWAIWNYRKKS